MSQFSVTTKLSWTGVTTALLSCNSGQFSSQGQDALAEKTKPTPQAVPSPQAPTGDTTGFQESPAAPIMGLSCELKSERNWVKSGSSLSILLQPSIQGPFDQVVFDGQEMDGGRTEFSVVLDSDKTLVANIKKGSEVARCEIHLTAVAPQTSFREDQLLCAGKRGVGRSILVVNFYLKENTPQYLALDFQDIQKLTGIDSHIVNLDPANASDLQRHVAAKTYDAIWVISEARAASPSTFTYLAQHLKRGGGLALLGDDTPWNEEVNAVIRDYKPEWSVKLTGNYPGMKLIDRKGFGSNPGMLHDHPITKGLYQRISEGGTISQLSGGANSVLKTEKYRPVMTNSGGGVTTATIDEELPDDPGLRPAVPRNPSGKAVQRTVIHGAYTSLHREQTQYNYGWELEGTPQFVANMACWSVGL